MNVATISEDVDLAREKLAEYRDALKVTDDAEYERLAVAYAQLAKGKELIVLSQAIANAPRDAQSRPRLAIARADQRQVMYRRNDNAFETFSTKFGHGGHRFGRDFHINVRAIVPKPPDRWPSGFALVPIVPPAALRTGHRPRALNTHFILWEVETWADERIRARPDRDPYLLRRISDDLFAVVAEWDLTAIERAVMAGRARG